MWQKYSKSEHSFTYTFECIAFWLNLIPLNHFHSFRNVHKLVAYNDKKWTQSQTPSQLAEMLVWKVMESSISSRTLLQNSDVGRRRRKHKLDV